jgi:hypothetical protein
MKRKVLVWTGVFVAVFAAWTSTIVLVIAVVKSRVSVALPQPATASAKLALAAARPCQSTECGNWRDEDLVMRVQSKLQFSPLGAKVGSVVVTSKDCVVTLAGTVPEHHNVVEAERIAASVQGVRRVRNTLRVAQPQ